MKKESSKGRNMGNAQKCAEFAKKINYRFTDLRLLQKALVHSSYAFEKAQAGKDNERLEFIGDAVLDLVVGSLLYRRFPTMKEGELTKLRAALVNETHLASMARKLDLGYYLFLGKGEMNSNGSEKPSILSCAYEAVMGAIFEDGGYDVVAKFIENHFGPVVEKQKENMLVGDSKSRLQEILQEKFNEGPTYKLEKEDGPSHKKTFTSVVYFQEELLGRGEAGSKKESEQLAAATAIDKVMAK
ncbi:MAG: ribonuclease III [Desulfotalea sp.]